MPSRSDPERERKEGSRCVKKLDLLCLSAYRHAGLQPELVPHGDVSDWLLHTHTGCKSSQLFTAQFSVKFMCFICFRSSVSFSALQDGILFGMVGAYDWDGGVLKEGTNGRIMPPREAFESEFPLELKNHAAYLGTYIQYHSSEHDDAERIIHVNFAKFCKHKSTISPDFIAFYLVNMTS